MRLWATAATAQRRLHHAVPTSSMISSNSTLNVPLVAWREIALAFRRRRVAVVAPRFCMDSTEWRWRLRGRHCSVQCMDRGINDSYTATQTTKRPSSSSRDRRTTIAQFLATAVYCYYLPGRSLTQDSLARPCTLLDRQSTSLRSRRKLGRDIPPTTEIHMVDFSCFSFIHNLLSFILS